METQAVVLSKPEMLSVETLLLQEPGPDDMVVGVRYSGVSTGTEKLFYTGQMPSFPGMGYPLVPGYEAVGEVLEAPKNSPYRSGDSVFIPGANCYDGALGLFGGASFTLVTPWQRATSIDRLMGPSGVLLALAATAYNAIDRSRPALPELIVGHGVLGRLLARIVIALEGKPPTVWEIDPMRAQGAQGYEVCQPDADERRDYKTVVEASGDGAMIDALMSRLSRDGEIVLAGFYKDPISFAFAPAFMKQARLRIAAEWEPRDMLAVARLVEKGTLNLDGLISHTSPSKDAPDAYRTAFSNPDCLKMILDWSAS